MNSPPARLRDSRPIYFFLWCAIATGIVPATVGENLLPFDNVDFRFGIAAESFTYLPPSACLLVFLLAGSACILQRRPALIVLLLPWLAPVFFDIDQLQAPRPGQSAAIERLYDNLTLAAESPGLPDIEKLRQDIGQIAFRDSAIMQYVCNEASPRDPHTGGQTGAGDESGQTCASAGGLLARLDDIRSNLGSGGSRLDDRAARILAKFAPLNLKIAQAQNQIARIDKALRTTEIVSRLSFGLSDKHVKNKLRASRVKVVKQRDKLLAQRNAYRVELGRIKAARSQANSASQQLRELNAQVQTYLEVGRAQRDWTISTIYGAICFVVLTLLICIHGPGSWYFLSLLLASFGVSMLYLEAPLAFRYWLLIKLVVISLVIRIGYLIVGENFPLIRAQWRRSKRFVGRSCATTLVYYWPFIVLIGLGWWTKDLIDTRIDDRLYQLQHMRDLDRDEPRRENIDRGIDAFFEHQEREAHRLLGRISVGGKNFVHEFTADALGVFDTTLLPRLSDYNDDFTPQDCENWHDPVTDLGDCVRREILEALGEIYSDSRASLRGSLETMIAANARQANGNLRQAIAYAKADISENFLRARLGLKQFMERTYLVVDFVNWISLLVFIAMVLKSLFYIFARVFFAGGGKGGPVIQFEPGAEPLQRGSVRQASASLTLGADMGERIYVNKKYGFANAPPDEVTPQAHRAFFSRFVNGVWHLNAVRTAPPDSIHPPYRLIPDDERIVVWTLRPGDAVVFSWKSFVGMSDNCRVGLRYSWQLSSLIIGRMFYVVASVDPDSARDGTLLLAARGIDGIDRPAGASNSPDQLLAWHTTTRFELHARLSLRNMYRSGIQIRAVDGDLAVMHLVDSRRRAGVGGSLRYFLLPV